MNIYNTLYNTNMSNIKEKRSSNLEPMHCVILKILKCYHVYTGLGILLWNGAPFSTGENPGISPG